ncbi:hypothetical protein [Massilia sp. DD77]|uniref:hypothetical protein n=1 Tax=Massilia sp. DD77 TaxID=3109349 RepID=UPI003000E702
MPSLDWGGYLVGWLFEFGPTMAAGAGIGPLTATEIESWQRLLGLQFEPWEARLLRRLSVEYAGESAHATARDRPPPFADSTDARRLQRVELERKVDLFLS